MTIVFLGFMLATVLALFIITRVGVERIAHRHYLQRVDFFKEHPVNEEDIVMVGDSLTAGANWDEIFNDIPIKNRGINADLTTGLLARLDEITQGKPVAMFILIGTNDLPWYEYRPLEMIIDTYREILRKIKKDSPDSKVFVQSLLPRGKSYAKNVIKLNTRLKELAAAENVTFIDLYPHFVEKSGELRADLNNDHLHLLGKGYRIWQGILAPYIYSLKKQ